jgi:hypothetical protein
MKTNFYEFSQNNSGGYFDINSEVTHRMLIEALNPKHAESIMETLTENQSPSCSCCGDRWSLRSPDVVELDKYAENGFTVSVSSWDKFAEKTWLKKYGSLNIVEQPKWVENRYSTSFVGKVVFNTIEEYAQYEANEWGYDGSDQYGDTRIVYLDGTVKDFFKVIVE